MTGRGRWAALFADLAAEMEGAEAADLRAEVRDRTRAEHAKLTLADRLAAYEGAELAVTTQGAGTVRGRLVDNAADWLLVGDTLVPATAVVAVAGLGPAAAPPEARPRLQPPLGYALRALADTGDEVACTLRDGRVIRGAITRVGKDHVDIGGDVVPFAAIAAVRR